MAKVDAPLFSFNASGKLANALVYGQFKGLNTVRSYVTPANPNSAAQQQQRSYMTDANDFWHDSGYSEDDRSAWNRLASTLAKGLSGFNAFTRIFINESVAGGTPQPLHDAVVSAIGVAGFTATLVKASGGDVPVIHYGVSPTFMPNTMVLTDLTGNSWRAIVAGLLSGTLYYWYVDVGTPASDYMRTGIYATRTT